MRLPVLHGTLVLALGCNGPLREAVRPASGAVVDCDGDVLRPKEPWEEHEPVDRLDELTDQVGILLHDVEDVRIENCTIEGFEYAILALGGGGHEIVDNVLDSPWQAIGLEGAADVTITGNEIRGGNGISVDRRSHRAHIADNVIRQVHPGERIAIAVLDATSPDRAVYQHVVDGVLYQVPNEPGSGEDVLIEDNEIELDTTGFVGVFLGARTKDAVVRNNAISGGTGAIGYSGATGNPWIALPGTCSDRSSRYCSDDADCFLEGLDETSLGTCTFAGDRTCNGSGAPCTEDCDAEDPCGYHVPDSLSVEAARIETNTVTDTCEGIWGYVAVDTVVADNTLTGTVDFDRCTDGAGLFVQGAAFMTTRFEGNTVTGYGTGLALFQAAATSFGAVVTGNDFSGNEFPWWALAVDPFTFEPVPMFEMELSADGVGNYWGLTCAEGLGGFPQLTFCASGDNIGSGCAGPDDCPGGTCEHPSVTDSQAFGAPIGEGSVPCPP